MSLIRRIRPAPPEDEPSKGSDSPPVPPSGRLTGVRELQAPVSGNFDSVAAERRRELRDWLIVRLLIDLQGTPVERTLETRRLLARRFQELLGQSYVPYRQKSRKRFSGRSNMKSWASALWNCSFAITTSVKLW